MTPALHAKLQSWLESGTDTQKRHATAVLAIDDKIDDVPARRQHYGSLYSVSDSSRLLRLVRECRHRTPETECGCGGLASCALGKGRNGLVNQQECMACMKRKGEDEDSLKPLNPLKNPRVYSSGSSVAEMTFNPDGPIGPGWYGIRTAPDGTTAVSCFLDESMVYRESHRSDDGWICVCEFRTVDLANGSAFGLTAEFYPTSKAEIQIYGQSTYEVAITE